jgi:DNA replication protein DnaC
MPHWINQPWQRNLSKTASGKPGAVHTMLDRLLHHATVVQISGESYRLKDKRRAGVMDKRQGR